MKLDKLTTEELTRTNSFVQHKHPIRLQHRLINDHFQNYKPYAIPKAQLVIADIPYNVLKKREMKRRRK